MSKETETATENCSFVNPDHPHGPPDPRWIDDEGMCIFCGYTYYKSESEPLYKELTTSNARLRELELILNRALTVLIHCSLPDDITPVDQKLIAGKLAREIESKLNQGK